MLVNVPSTITVDLAKNETLEEKIEEIKQSLNLPAKYSIEQRSISGIGSLSTNILTTSLDLLLYIQDEDFSGTIARKRIDVTYISDECDKIVATFPDRITVNLSKNETLDSKISELLAVPEKFELTRTGWSGQSNVTTSIRIKVALKDYPTLFSATKDIKIEYTCDLLEKIKSIIPNQINLDIPEVEFEKAQELIEEKMQEILNANGIDKQEMEQQGIEVHIYGPYLYLGKEYFYKSNIDIEYNNIYDYNSKEIEISYNNTNNYNSTDEQIVKNLNLKSPRYYKISFDNLSSAGIFFNTIENYYTSAIKDNSIIVKATAGAGSLEGLNEWTAESGTFIGIFKNGILYDVRIMGQEGSIPVINIPNTIKDSEITNYVITQIKNIKNSYLDNYYQEYADKITDVVKVTTENIDKYVGTDWEDILSIDNVYVIEVSTTDFPESLIIINKEESSSTGGNNSGGSGGGGSSSSGGSSSGGGSSSSSGGQNSDTDTPTPSPDTNVNITNKMLKEETSLIKDKVAMPCILQNDTDSLKIADVKNYYKDAQKILCNNEEISDDTKLKTGDILNIDGNEKTVIIYGDVYADGEINILDAVAVLNHIKQKQQLNDVTVTAAKSNNDNKELNILDAVRLLNIVKGKLAYKDIIENH